MSGMALVAAQVLPLLMLLICLLFSKAAAASDTGLMSLPVSAAKEEGDKHIFI